MRSWTGPSPQPPSRSETPTSHCGGKSLAGSRSTLNRHQPPKTRFLISPRSRRSWRPPHSSCARSNGALSVWMIPLRVTFPPGVTRARPSRSGISWPTAAGFRRTCRFSASTRVGQPSKTRSSGLRARTRPGRRLCTATSDSCCLASSWNQSPRSRRSSTRCVCRWGVFRICSSIPRRSGDHGRRPRASIRGAERLLVGEVDDDNAWALGGAAGHAGLFGAVPSVGDCARHWLQVLEGRKGVFTQETARTFIARRTEIQGSSRALGWDTMLPTSSCGTRMSSRAFGHVGFTGTSLWIDPDRICLRRPADESDPPEPGQPGDHPREASRA